MKNLIFLGAGASKADGVPLQNELFKEYFSMLKKDRDNSCLGLYDGVGNTYIPSYIKVEREIKDFFKDFFGFKDINEHCVFPTFEEALGIIELAINRKEDFFQYCETFNLDSLKCGKYETIRLTLILAMAEIIDFKIRKSNGYIHSKLIYNLKSRNDFAFISTNYDTLIDNAIIENKKNINYGFNFVQDTINSDSIYLCKIHGSLNWLYCSVCKNIIITKHESGVINLLDSLIKATCPKCNSLMKPIIVPPSFFKDYQNIYLNNVWNKIEQLLIGIKKIIFCGYSFPDADIYIKYLLKRTEMINHNDIIYYVVNNCSNKSDIDKKIERLRFERFFNDKSKIIYTDLSFQDFANNPFDLLR